MSLQVRSAGEEAWLGAKAPYDAKLDDEQESESGIESVFSKTRADHSEAERALVKRMSPIPLI